MTERSLFFGNLNQKLTFWPVATPVISILVTSLFFEPIGPQSRFAVAVCQFSVISAFLLPVFFIVMNSIGMDGWSSRKAVWPLKIVTLWLLAITTIACNF